jgi:MFS family permease
VFANLSRVFGWGFLPIALIAKLPFAMSVVAVMTAVSSTRDSFTLAGATAALVGVGTALFGPLLGAAADRWGQRPVLLATAVANTAALFGLAFALRAEASAAVVLIAGFLIGASAPQASSMVRTRWLHAIRAEFSGERARRATSTVLSYESMTDELVFVFGPVLVGFIAVALGVVVPLDFAAVLTVLGVITFALHPSVRYVRGHARTARRLGDTAAGDASAAADATAAGGVSGGADASGIDGASAAEHRDEVAPVSLIFRAVVLVPVAGMTAIGLFFGSSLTALTNFMGQFGQEDATGIFYGIMGVGSALCALGVVLLPERFTFVARWLVFSGLAVAGSLLLIPAEGLGLVVPSLLIMGCGIGPCLVTLYSIASEVAPLGRTTTVMAMMSTGVVVGQSASSAATGAIVDLAGYREGFFVAIAALALLLVLSLVQMTVNRPAAGDTRRTARPNPVSPERRSREA